MRGVNIGRIMGFGIAPKGVEVRLEIEGEYTIPKDSRGGAEGERAPRRDGGRGHSRRLGRGDRLGRPDPRRRAGSGSSTRWTRSPARRTRSRSRCRTCCPTRWSQDLQGGAVGGPAVRSSSLQAILNEQRGELRALSASLKRSAEGMEKVTTGAGARAHASSGWTQLVLRLDGTVGTLDKSSKSLESILARIDRGEGTLGQAEHRRHALRERLGGDGQPQQGLAGARPRSWPISRPTLASTSTSRSSEPRPA